MVQAMFYYETKKVCTGLRNIYTWVILGQNCLQLSETTLNEFFFPLKKFVLLKAI